MRDDFPMAVKELLAKRVASECSSPGCGQVTIGPQVDPAGVVNLGVAAHITAASPGGPRYDPSLTEDERRSHTNGIWLCQTCAKLVDNDVLRYPADVLREWKVFAEGRAARNLEGRGRAPISASPFDRLERLMPTLLAEKRQDIADQPLLRECVLKKKTWVYNGGGVFSYYFDDHPDLEGQFHMLENYGFVRNATRTTATRYRFSEELVQYLEGRPVIDSLPAREQTLEVFTGTGSPYEKVVKPSAADPARRLLRLAVKNPGSTAIQRVQVDVEALGSDRGRPSEHVEFPYILRQGRDFALWSTSEYSRFPRGEDQVGDVPSRTLEMSFGLDGLETMFLDVVDATDGSGAVTIVSTRQSYRLSPATEYEFLLLIHGNGVRSSHISLVCRRQTERWILEVRSLT